jgi:HSP90 family molecular chaperone
VCYPSSLKNRDWSQRHRHEAATGFGRLALDQTRVGPDIKGPRPARLVGDARDMTPTLERIYRAIGAGRAAGQADPRLNPTHRLLTGLRAAHEQYPDDQPLPETAELPYGTALLAEGGDRSGPARFARLLADRLSRTL